MVHTFRLTSLKCTYIGGKLKKQSTKKFISALIFMMYINMVHMCNTIRCVTTSILRPIVFFLHCCKCCSRRWQAATWKKTSTDR